MGRVELKSQRRILGHLLQVARLRGMRALIQRTKWARVTVNSTVVASIGQGMLVLLGVARTDSSEDAALLAKKLANLRIFDDGAGKLNLSVTDIGGEILLVSQFTLLGRCRKGNRPNFMEAAEADRARELFDEVVQKLREANVPVQVGIFGSKMLVELCNDGPVTLLLDTAE